MVFVTTFLRHPDDWHGSGPAHVRVQGKVRRRSRLVWLSRIGSKMRSPLATIGVCVCVCIYTGGLVLGFIAGFMAKHSRCNHIAFMESKPKDYNNPIWTLWEKPNAFGDCEKRPHFGPFKRPVVGKLDLHVVQVVLIQAAENRQSQRSAARILSTHP